MNEEYTGPDRRRVTIDHDLLIRMDENVKFIRDQMTNHFKEDSAQFTESNIRLSNIERWRWQVAGALVVVVVVVEFVGKMLNK